MTSLLVLGGSRNRRRQEADLGKGRGTRLTVSAAAIFLAIVLAGCGHKEGGGHDHRDGDGHDHEKESSSGAWFAEGEGVVLADETRKSLGVEVMEVAERTLPSQIRFTLQVFGEKHHHLIHPEDHTGCDVQGSAFLSEETAASAKPGQAVDVLKGTNKPLGGVVLAVQKALALGESEIVIGVSNAAAALKPGEFVPARINIPRDKPVLAIPQAALLRASEGTFVYAVKDRACLRTAVKVGAEADGWVEIVDGVLPGDRVVTKPVQTLWLIELRATRGGGHSH